MITRTSLVGPIFAALCTLVAHPRTADACQPDPCAYSDKWEAFQLSHDVVATDGVLVFIGPRGNDALTDQEALAFVSVSVMIDDIVIPGAIEVAASDTYVWRPDSGLAAGAQLAVTVSVDNESLAGDFDECWYEIGPIDYEVSVGAGPMMPEAPATFTAEAYRTDPSEALEDLVCCDGAYPYLEIQCIEDVYWDMGFCTPLRGTGFAEGTIELRVDELDPMFAANLSWIVHHEEGDQDYSVPVGFASRTLTFAEPFCAHAEVRNLATDEVYELETECFGDDLDLGEVDVDPRPALEGGCETGAYVCDVVDDAWDETNCEPYYGDGGGSGTGSGEGGDGDGDTGDAGADGGVDLARGGCGCTTDNGAPTGLLPLIVLPLFMRRRGRPD